MNEDHPSEKTIKSIRFTYANYPETSIAELARRHNLPYALTYKICKNDRFHDPHYRGRQRASVSDHLQMVLDLRHGGKLTHAQISKVLDTLHGCKVSGERIRRLCKANHKKLDAKDKLDAQDRLDAQKNTK